MLTLLFFLALVSSSHCIPQLVGGYSDVDNPNEDEYLKSVAVDTTTMLASSFGSPDDCQLKLVKILKASSQVVAGTNYRMELRLEIPASDHCEHQVKDCKGIKVFKPLPYQCTDGKICVHLKNQEEISCEPVGKFE